MVAVLAVGVAVMAAAAAAVVVVPHSASPTWKGGNSRKGTSLQILPLHHIPQKKGYNPQEEVMQHTPR